MAQILPCRQQQPIGAAKTYTTLGDRAFQVAAPKLWNNLPFILILEVHYFYHLLRKHLRCIFLEKHSLKYFNCLHDVCNFPLDIKASFYFFVIHLILILLVLILPIIGSWNQTVELSFYLNLNFSRSNWQKNLNFTSEFIMLRAIFFSVRNFITLILVAGLATSVSR